MSIAPKQPCWHCEPLVEHQRKRAEEAERDGATLVEKIHRDEAEWTALHARLQTVADEAFGPFPVMSVDDLVTEIERGIHRERRAVTGGAAPPVPSGETKEPK